ncbi:uncharacterized protein LOC116340734 [Contarinia nasturtii]|uniref:uncharacterized protein LOC116340734 n=1 Tax=Contarinia nasturtii TaxID=265458 RepID=UPI0012D45208|nr:uncharacterized protein LOC116340734 [Contarinia nasturtii]
MKLFLIFAFVSSSIFNQFGSVNCQSAVYSALLKALNIKLENGRDLVRNLKPLFSLPSDGLIRLRGRSKLSSDKWVESYLQEEATFSYIHVEEMCRNRVSTEVNNNLCDRLCDVLNAYKGDVINIGKVYHDIFLVYSSQPSVHDINGFESALNEFKRKQFERGSEINGELGSMQTRYHQLVNEVNAEIDQSVTLVKQYLAQATSFKYELKNLFLQTKKIDGRKLYDSAQLDVLNTALAALRGKQLELTTCLQKLLSDIQDYNDQRIEWAGFLLDTTLPPRPPNKLGVMGH